MLAKTTSNRFGIGARLEAVVQGRRIIREMYPVNSFQSQMPMIVHFGLAEAALVDELTIRWPSGRVQKLEKLQLTGTSWSMKGKKPKKRSRPWCPVNRCNVDESG